MPLSDFSASDRQPMYQNEGQGGAVVAVFCLEKDESGMPRIVGRSPEQPQAKIEKALMEFRRLTDGAFSPEGRCAADRAFVQVLSSLAEDFAKRIDSSIIWGEDSATTGDDESPGQSPISYITSGLRPCSYSGDHSGPTPHSTAPRHP